VTPRRGAALRKALSALDDPNRHVGTHIDADLAFHLLLCELSRNLGWSTPGATWRVEYASPF
jgi:DNA-binding FadR family transcriptional regulator